MTWTAMDGWIVAAGMLSAVACALPGCYLVLRRMSLMGDAISHAVLPGLAAAFLLTGSRAGWPMFVGAAVVGLLTAMLTEWIHRLGKVEESAAMGVVFTTLFALGLIGIVRAADHVDLDPGCVLYGAIELTSLPLPGHTLAIGGFAVPQTVARLGAVALVNLLAILVFYKELKIAAFDPELATAVGIPARRVHYGLMALVAVTTVACFESVGSILVIAMLVVPPAAAYLLTDRLGVMLALSAAIAALSAVAGHVGAVTLPGYIGFPGASTSTAGMMAVACGLLFLLALIASPRHGILIRCWRRARLDLNILSEDLLGLLYRLEERGAAHAASAPAVLRDAMGVGAVARHLALWNLQAAGHIARDSAGTWHITAAGQRAAQNIVRTHRLWESYLHKHLDLQDSHAHTTAERLEHVTDVALQERLAERTDRPERDPQGRRIPPPSS